MKDKQNQGKDHRTKFGCQSCGHSWIPRTTSPSYCPKCRNRLPSPTPKEATPKETRGKVGEVVKEWLPSAAAVILIIRFLLELAGFVG